MRILLATSFAVLLAAPALAQPTIQITPPAATVAPASNYVDPNKLYATPQERGLPWDALNLIRKGLDALLYGNVDLAITEFRNTIGTSPREAEAHYALAVGYKKKGQYGPAIDEMQNAINLYPVDDVNHRAKSLYGLALIFELKGDWRESADAWQAYIEFAKPYTQEIRARTHARERLEIYECLIKSRSKLKQQQAEGKPIADIPKCGR